MSEGIKNKVAIITGASRGIGRAIAASALTTIGGFAALYGWAQRGRSVFRFAATGGPGRGESAHAI